MNYKHYQRLKKRKNPQDVFIEIVAWIFAISFFILVVRCILTNSPILK